MTDQDTVLYTIRRARFEAEVLSIMASRNPRQHATMNYFAGQSEAFVKLRSELIDHYFAQQQQRPLSPLFCVDAVTSLVDQALETITRNARQAA